ncbi:MAG TPA: type III pantothenate kinase [Thiobacillaceae bacterium]|nr:type III pantothenate kinase [Thiobacillaceae bacterium]
MSILLVDIGNSRIKWTLNRDEHAVAHGAHLLGEAKSFRTAIVNLARPERVIACNVAGETGQEALSAAVSAWGLVPQWVTASREAHGVINCYAIAENLGPDRWAALIAAHAMGLGETLVVSLGTAMTVDWLRANGEFAGGMIIPGLRLMREALAHGTEGVGYQQGKISGFACSTADAVEGGLACALSGALRQARQTVIDATRHAPVCLVTGGDGAWLAALLDFPVVLAPDLVLQGLALMARGNEH